MRTISAICTSRSLKKTVVTDVLPLSHVPCVELPRNKGGDPSARRKRPQKVLGVSARENHRASEIGDDLARKVLKKTIGNHGPIF